MRAIKIILYSFLAVTAIGVFFYMKDSHDEDHDIDIDVHVDDDRDIDLRQVEALSVTGAYSVYLVQDNDPFISISGDDDDRRNVKTELDGHTLKISSKKNSWMGDRIQIKIGLEKIEKIKLAGSVSLKTESVIDEEDLNVWVSGASDLDMDLHTEDLDIQVSGSGKVKLDGKAEESEISISGAGIIKAYDLENQRMRINISGAGEAQVHANEELEVRVSGAGRVRYKGSPLVTKRVSGAGSVVKAD